MFFVDTPPSSRGFIKRVSPVRSLVPRLCRTDKVKQGDITGEVAISGSVLVIGRRSDVVGE